MDSEVLLAIKVSASAFEFLLMLLLLPQALSRRPDRGDPDYMLQILLLTSLAKSAFDCISGLFPGAFTAEVLWFPAGALEITVATLWYFFIAAYLWNNRRPGARGIRLSFIWLGIWLAVAFAGLATGELQKEMQVATGARWLYQLLCWITFIPLLLSESLLLCRHKNLGSRDIVLLALFPLPAVIGLLLAYACPELLWKSPGLSFTLLAVSLYLQNRTTQKDPLTGAHTRAWFKAKLTERLREAQTSPFMLLMIDMDHFKRINDTWGHLEGDRALITVVELLQKSLRSSDIIARFAGDEFLVLANIANPGECDIILKRIKSHLMEYNMNSGKPYTLSWSTGMLYCDRPQNPDELLSSVDGHMYQQKKLSKRSVSIG